jgi:flagellar motor switch protein FliM
VEPILSKEEISDLLSAIKSGTINVDSIEDRGPGHGIPKIAKEVDLFGLYSRDEASGEMRIPNLDIVLDVFARNFGTTLTNTLQRTFLVERGEIVTSNFQNSLMELNNKGAIGIYSTDPLKYGCLFHFDNLLAFTLLEIMLGSSSANELIALDRNMTPIEINVLKNTMVGICSDLGKAMKPVVAMKPELIKAENNFRLVNIVDADTEVLISTFQIKSANEQAGTLRLIIPYLTLEPVRDKFKEIVSVTHASYTWGKTFAKEALNMPFLVTARSGTLSLSIRDIVRLKTGDIVDLGYDPDRPLDILVEDKQKFSAVPGERNGKKAFHITGAISNSVGEQYGRQ